jgi:hypothetical protein
MSTLPRTADTLSADQKATYDLVSSLLDARFNLARSLPEAEAKLQARKDAAVKELGRATTADALIAASKTVATALDQLQKDIAALKQSPRLVTECFNRLEKNSREILRMGLEDRKIKDEKGIGSTDQLAFKEDLDFVRGELSKLNSHGGTKKKTAPKPTKKVAKKSAKGTSAATPATP